jgi:hypothetical protein
MRIVGPLAVRVGTFFITETSIISNGDRVARIAYGSGAAIVSKTPVLTLTLKAAAATSKDETGPTVTSEAIIQMEAFILLVSMCLFLMAMTVLG